MMRGEFIQELLDGAIIKSQWLEDWTFQWIQLCAFHSVAVFSYRKFPLCLERNVDFLEEALGFERFFSTVN